MERKESAGPGIACGPVYERGWKGGRAGEGA